MKQFYPVLLAISVTLSCLIPPLNGQIAKVERLGEVKETFNSFSFRVEPSGTFADVVGNRILTSTDEGQTWDTTEAPDWFDLVSGRHKGNWAELPSGELILFSETYNQRFILFQENNEWETALIEGDSIFHYGPWVIGCLLYTSPSPRDATLSRMPSSA